MCVTEVLTIKINNIDFNNQFILLEECKNGNERIIEILDIIDELIVYTGFDTNDESILKSIAGNILELEEEIKVSLDTIKDKEEEFQKANQLFEDYHIKLKQCKNAENPDTDLMEELEEKIENQTKIVENYQEHLEYLKEEHNKLKDDKNENISKRKAVQADAHKKLVDLKNEIENL